MNSEQVPEGRAAAPHANARERGVLLVPIDGSAEAERALAIAEQVARQTHRALLLVRVVPALTPAHVFVAGPEGRPLLAYDELCVAEERLVQDYLDGVRRISCVGRSRCAP
jgi:nucleotide-binding universal stress UspA family protein